MRAEQRTGARVGKVDRHHRQVDELGTVTFEVELLDHLAREREETARADLVPAALEDLARPGHSADVAVLLQNEGLEAAAREHRGRSQAVVARTDHDHV